MLKLHPKHAASVLILAVICTILGCSGNGSSTATTATTATPQVVSSSVAWLIPDGTSQDATQMASIFDAGQLYFNVQSNASVTGEIRGGITPSPSGFQTDAGNPFAPNPSNIPVTFSTILDGDQVRARSIITNARGYGSVTIDPLTRKLTGFIVTSGISGIAAQIQDGLPGFAGAAVLSLEGGPVVWTIPANTQLTDAQIANLSAGAYYFTVSSGAFPNGEIRGQLDKQVRCASLKGSNEIPPVTTSASGSGYLALKQTSRQFSGFVNVAGLSSTITAIFLHIGPAGVNGTSILTLENRGNGVWTVPLNVVLSDAQIANFNNDEMYFNVHTVSHLPGEIRGQILKSSIKIGTAALDGSKEIPPVSSSGSGSGILALNMVTGQLSGSVSTNGVNGTVVQLQSGSANVTDPPLAALSTSSPVITTPTASISYSLDIQPIFTAKCAVDVCHVTGGTTPMSLQTGLSYANIIFLVSPKSSSTSYLIDRLTGAISPQMPLNRTPLSISELDLIKAWIDNGALNN